MGSRFFDTLIDNPCIPLYTSPTLVRTWTHWCAVFFDSLLCSTPSLGEPRKANRRWGASECTTFELRLRPLVRSEQEDYHLAGGADNRVSPPQNKKSQWRWQLVPPQTLTPSSPYLECKPEKSPRVALQCWSLGRTSWRRKFCGTSPLGLPRRIGRLQRTSRPIEMHRLQGRRHRERKIRTRIGRGKGEGTSSLGSHIVGVLVPSRTPKLSGKSYPAKKPDMRRYGNNFKWYKHATTHDDGQMGESRVEITS